MTSLLYVGPPGCGKTYKAISGAKSFVIAVPCRQLAYEIYLDYQQVSRIDTGEVHMGDFGNKVCVYENLSDEVIDQDTLIIDEAHYLNDLERGGALFDKIMRNKAAGKRIVLLTATDTLSDEVREALGVVEVEVLPFVTAPRKVEINFEQFCKKVARGMTAIVFTKYVPTEDDVAYYADLLDIEHDKIGMISALTPTLERVQTQIKFKEGALQVVVSSNVLAQGVNFPAQGVFIEYNEHDDWETTSQKIGRVARPLFGINEGYYCLYVMPFKRKKRGLPERAERQAYMYVRPSMKTLNIASWGFASHEIPSSLSSYRGYRYAHRFLRTLAQRAGGLEPAEQAALAFLDDQSSRLCELLAERKSAALSPV